MKTSFVYVVFGFLFFLSSTHAQELEIPKSTITLNILGLRSSKGSVMVALHNTKDTFLKRKEPFRHAVVPIEKNQAQAIFKEVPQGTYGFAVFHDVNENKELDTYFGMIPKEDFGFSNNVIKKYGPPKYKETLFELNKETFEMVIHVGPSTPDGKEPPASLEKLASGFEK